MTIYVIRTKSQLAHILFSRAGSFIYFQFTICVPIDSSFWFYTIHSGWSIVYMRGSQVIISIQNYIYFSKYRFVTANSADPDEMPHDAAFNLGLHYLPKYSSSMVCMSKLFCKRLFFLLSRCVSIIL